MTTEDDKNRAHAEAMKALKAEREALMAEKTDAAGLLLVHTGAGPGKSRRRAPWSPRRDCSD